MSEEENREAKRWRIAVCEFHQETNSFAPMPSTRRDYEAFGIQQGEEMLLKADAGSALKGMIDLLQSCDCEIIPTYRMWANAAGPVETEVVDEFLTTTIRVIRKYLPLDGVCVSLHGATQSTASEDVCGDIVTAIRELCGPDTVIAVSVDLHANITGRISGNADFVCGYHTYPHVDFYETGKRAAALCLKKIGEETSVYRKHFAIPMIIPASGYSTTAGDFAEIMAYGEHLVEEGELLDFSIFPMQPWLDVADAQSSIVTYSLKKDDPYCRLIAEKLVNKRESFTPALRSAESVIREAEHYDDGRPVVLVDSADSSNAGSSGDSAFVLGEVLRLDSDVRAAIVLCCKPAAEQAFRMGVGARGCFRIGAAISPDLSEPVWVNASVISLHDGDFILEGPARRGLCHSLGRTAVLQARNTRVIVTSDFLLGPGDLQLFRHFGIEPTFCQLVAVKACTSFRASYEKITDRIYDADTPGAATPKLTRLSFRRLSSGFYPFHEISCADILEI